MPVRAAVQPLQVVAKQGDLPHAPPGSLRNQGGAAVGALTTEPRTLAANTQGLQLGLGRHQQAGALRAHLGQVLAPPGEVEPVDDVGPGASAEGGVGDEDGSADSSALPVFAPPARGFAVCLGEAWAAGDADGLLPAAGVGPGVPGLAGAGSVDSRTKPDFFKARACTWLTRKVSPQRRRPSWSKPLSAMTSIVLMVLHPKKGPPCRRVHGSQVDQELAGTGAGLTPVKLPFTKASGR